MNPSHSQTQKSLSNNTNFDMKQWALKYASLNWCVLPLHYVQNGNCSCGNQKCEDQGKHPLLYNGASGASSDLNKINQWWEKWPKANIGVLIGPKSNLCVLDIDPRNGGDVYLKKFLKPYGEIPKTIESTTGGGGKHYLFDFDQKFNVPSEYRKNGVEIKKSANTYFVAPPSTHISGNRYSWESSKSPFEIKPIEVPQFLTLSDSQDRKAEQLPKIIEEGNRNTLLTSLAGSMRHRGASQESIESALLIENETRCNPPLEKSEVLSIARSVSKYSPDKNSHDNLILKHGKPYYYNSYGSVSSINQVYWAGLHKSLHIEIFEPNEKTFYRYNDQNGLYIEISEDIIKKEIAEEMLKISRQDNVPNLESKRTNATLSATVSHLKGLCEKKDAFSKADKKFIHLANGILCIPKKGEKEFVKFSPKLYSRNQSPINYDPNATCPHFINDFLLPAVSEGDALLLQKYAGLSLLGVNLIQRFLILDGTPGRGKSTYSLIIQALIGNTNVTQLRTNLLHERFELYRFLKKTLLIGVDVPGKFLSQKGAEVIKALVGGDILDTEQKGGNNNFPIKGNFCIVITSNSRLQIRLDGDIEAWRRRLAIARFDAPPPKKKIPDFDKYIIDKEGSGILNWALEGLQLLSQDIEKYGDIQLSHEQKLRTDALLAESDSLRKFLLDELEISNEEDLTVNEIVEEYAQYCPTKGWNPKPTPIIHRELESLMLELFQTSKSGSIKRDGKSSRGFRHVGFKI